MSPLGARGAGLCLVALSLACAPAARLSLSTPAKAKPRDAPSALCGEIARDPDSPEATRALAELFRHWLHPSDPSGVQLGGCQIVFDAAVPGSFEAGYFDRWAPAADFSVADLPRKTRAGVGVPLVALRQNREQEPIERHYPPEAIARAVTAVASAAGEVAGVPTIRVQLLSSLAHETLSDALGERPLAADFTVPWAALLERASALRASWLRGLTKPEPPRVPQLYLMEPYDPHKRPLILVHGLLSTPITFAALTNELWSNAEVRSRYQVWHYLYPTSAPVLYSARIFRQRIDEVRALLRDGGAPPPMVVLGHSMGGLLAKTLVTSSGEAAWNTIFTVPLSALHGTPEDLASLDDILHWRARSDVRRVIFVAVPHLGSERSAGAAGHLAHAVADVPPDLVALAARVDRENPGALAPAFEAPLVNGELTSIDTLSPRYPLLPILAALPFAPGVGIHSIIGGQDAVVARASSHLEGVDSELVVPAGHGAFKHPLALQEIERILALP